MEVDIIKKLTEFNADHVIESILEHLNPDDWKSCCRVSRSAMFEFGAISTQMNQLTL